MQSTTSFRLPAIVRKAVVLCAALACIAAYADDLTAAKRADIKTLMELTRTADLSGNLANLIMIGIVRQLQARGWREVPQRSLQALRDDMLMLFRGKVDEPGGLREKVEEDYSRNFTHAEIKELVAFYKGPTGQKWVNAAPTMGRETSETAQSWIKSIQPIVEARVNERLKKEGLDGPPPGAPVPPAK